MKNGVFIGLAGIDLIYYQDNIPKENQKSKTNDYDMQIGGPAANAAITYSVLGGKAVLITCIGDSEMGKNIKKELTDVYRIKVIDFASGNSMLPCISAISVNNATASRTIWSGQQIFSIDEHTNFAYEIENSEFCFSDCNLPVISETVINTARNFSKNIILDAGSWKENMGIYLSAASEVIASADCRCPEGTDFFVDAEKYGVKNIAVTNGGKAIVWKSGSESGEIYPPIVEAKDTLGAGDVFHGAYCYFKTEKGLSFKDSLERASKVASMSVQYKGAIHGVKKYVI